MALLNDYYSRNRVAKVARIGTMSHRLNRFRTISFEQSNEQIHKFKFRGRFKALGGLIHAESSGNVSKKGVCHEPKQE